MAELKWGEAHLYPDNNQSFLRVFNANDKLVAEITWFNNTAIGTELFEVETFSTRHFGLSPSGKYKTLNAARKAIEEANFNV